MSNLAVIRELVGQYDMTLLKFFMKNESKFCTYILYQFRVKQPKLREDMNCEGKD